jgi:hypothetical protein
MKWLGCRNLELSLLAASITAGLAAPLAAQAPTPAPTVSLLRNSNLAQQVWPGDFNGDGITDLAATAPRVPGAAPSPVLITLGKGDGTYGPPIRTPYIGHVAGTGDFNNDGKLDLIVVEDAPPGVDVSILLGKGDGTFPTARRVNSVDEVMFAIGADLNGDGFRDVIIGTSSDVIQIYPGRADGTYPDIITLTGSLFIHGAILGDFNGDGKQDIAVANHYGKSLTIFTNQGGFTFLSADIPLDMQANSVTAGDLNRDGKTDLVVAMSDGGDFDYYFHDGAVAVLLGKGNGTFDAPVKYAIPPGGWRVVVGDFNRDGIIDVATANRSSLYYDGCGPVLRTWDSLSILPGKGDGTLALPSNFSIGNQGDLESFPDNVNQVVSLNTSDLNGDRATDLIVSDGTMFLNRPVNTNTAPRIDLSESWADSELVALHVKVADDDHDMVTYRWTASDGASIPPVPRWCVGSWATPGTHTYTVTVDDGHGHQTSASVSFTVPVAGTGSTSLSITAPTEASTLTSGTAATIGFHIDDTAQALYQWSIDYSLDNGSTWNHIPECHNVGRASGPGVPTSRDEQCTWINPGPASAQALIVVQAKNAGDAAIARSAPVRVTIAPQPGNIPHPW